MRRLVFHLSAASLLTLVFSSAGFAQRHEIPVLSSCIKEFYDREMYNYLTFKNACSQSVTMVFVAKDGSGITGTMELRPGGKDSVGKLAGKAPKLGGFEFYVCQSGYMPLDDKGEVVSKPNMNFRCQPKSQ